MKKKNLHGTNRRQVAHIHQSHVSRQISILQTGFEKGYQRNISVRIISKSDPPFQRRRILKNFFMAIIIVQDAPIHKSHVSWWIKISQFLKRVTQGTFLWNYFKIWSAVSSEEEFFKEFIHKFPLVLVAPMATRAVFLDGSKFLWTVFGTRLPPKENPCEVYFKFWPSRFRRKRCFKNFLISAIRASSFPHSPEPHVFRRIKIIRITFGKGHPRNISCEITSKSDQPVSEKKNFYRIPSILTAGLQEAPHSTTSHIFWRIKIYVNSFL